MEWSKLKNIIILLLLIVNLFLLLLTGGHWQQRHRAQEELRRETIEFVRSKGIALDESIVPHTPTLPLQSTERDLSAEMKIAERALADVQQRVARPTSEYQGSRGSARFYADGRFLLTFKMENAEQVNDPERHAVSYLKSLGIHVLLLDTVQEGADTLVRVVQQLDGAPIFTCQMELRYQDGILYSVQGWRLLGTPTEDTSTKEPFDAATLLLRLLEGLRQEEAQVTELRAITIGYGYATASLSARAELVPLWRIETEKGNYYLNCMTGALEPSTLWVHE